MAPFVNVCDRLSGSSVVTVYAVINAEFLINDIRRTGAVWFANLLTLRSVARFGGGVMVGGETAELLLLVTKPTKFFSKPNAVYVCMP